MSIPTLITFIAYFIALLGIGLSFYRKSAGIEDVDDLRQDLAQAFRAAAKS